ncbi:MAG: hypothetical protein ACFCBV_02355 [Phycisphaerales bacterium]
MVSVWGGIYELVRHWYPIAFSPLVLVVVVGFVLYFVARNRPESLAARFLYSLRPLKHRALRDHPTICAACGYPVASGPQCPECSASYAEPGAILYRHELLGRAVRVPGWLRLALVALVIVLAAWAIAPVGRLIGGAIEWDTLTPANELFHAEYTTANATAGPNYSVQLSADYVVDAAPGSTRAPLWGHVTFILDNYTTKDLGWLNVDLDQKSWVLHFYQGGFKPPFQPASSANGTAIDTGISELYRVMGLDQFWAGSPAEVADLQRLAALAIGGEFRTIEELESLSNDPGALVWTQNTLARSSGKWYKFRLPTPTSTTGGLLGLGVLSVPILMSAGYAVLRVIKRYRA